MSWLRIRHPVLVLAALWLVLYFDYSGIARIGILAALIHESGHVVVWCAFTRKKPVLWLSIGGIGMDTDGSFLPNRQIFWLASAGPLANFVAFGVCYICMLQTASFWGYYFAAANLCIGLFNLIPLGSLDGRQMLDAIKG